MKSGRSLTLLIALEVVALCACIVVLGVLVVAAGLTGAGPIQSALLPPPTEEVVASPTRRETSTRAPTITPAPTYTRVLPPLPPNVTSQPGLVFSRTPTALPPSYSIPVLTPTAAPLAYPIAYTSTLVVSTYAVAGDTEQALSDSLNAHARANSSVTGGEFYARTDWRMTTQYRTHPTARGCEVESGSISLAITVTLPILAAGQALPTDLDNQWTKFVSNTITHESGHVKIVEQDARRLQRQLGNAAPASNCNVLEATLDDTRKAAVGVISQDNSKYDSQTNHASRRAD
ncbi:MAG: DUF922 domain-containing Zn-dependent protease [Chloroflexi bacterium]|nr:DUF922 domain-containing Zn-dependent protease [Chloroflexota bacterium]